MKYTYTAYYYYDEETETHRVAVPALDIEIETEAKTPEEAGQRVKEEMLDILHIYELDGIERPADNAEPEAGYDMSRKLTVDTASNGERIVSVRRIEF